MAVKLAVLGATGQVGSVMINILQERKFPVDHIRFFATSHSAGKSIKFFDGFVEVEDISKCDFKGIDIALMSIGADASKEFSPLLAKQGAVVIDNSKAFRMDPDVPLVVSEVNPEDLNNIKKNIVANPNCTTMVAMPVLAPLDKHFGLKSINVCSYQAVSGAGRNGVKEFVIQNEQISNVGTLAFSADESKKLNEYVAVFPEKIAYNVIPLAGSLLGDETTEEEKLREESRKILHNPSLAVGALCVRVPVVTGHSLAVTGCFERAVDIEAVKKILSNSKGVRIEEIPTPLKATGADEVLVGRIKLNGAFQNAVDMFICGDNLRKGAALNAIQVAELLLSKF
jgi:aspartate-semialdehyde dehydrogenase